MIVLLRRQVCGFPERRLASWEVHHCLLRRGFLQLASSILWLQHEPKLSFSFLVWVVSMFNSVQERCRGHASGLRADLRAQGGWQGWRGSSRGWWHRRERHGGARVQARRWARPAPSRRLSGRRGMLTASLPLSPVDVSGSALCALFPPRVICAFLSYARLGVLISPRALNWRSSVCTA